MKLTEFEQEICDSYSAMDDDGKVHCNECPLNLSDWYGIECYETIHDNSKKVKHLKRYYHETKSIKKKDSQH